MPQYCDSTCSHCARAFFAWYKARMAQMAAPRGRRAERSGGGSFTAAAATSVRPPRLAVGVRVRVTTLAYPHDAVVTHYTGHVGLDGRRWVQVSVERPNRPAWVAHFEARHLEVRP